MLEEVTFQFRHFFPPVSKGNESIAEWELMEISWSYCEIKWWVDSWEEVPGRPQSAKQWSVLQIQTQVMVGKSAGRALQPCKTNLLQWEVPQRPEWRPFLIWVWVFETGWNFRMCLMISVWQCFLLTEEFGGEREKYYLQSGRLWKPHWFLRCLLERDCDSPCSFSWK